jgi:hypothetical protein
MTAGNHTVIVYSIMAFYIIEKSLPNDLVDRIAREVHWSNMRPVHDYITSSVLYKYINEATADMRLMDRLQADFPGIMCHLDEDYYYRTKVFMVGNDHAIVYHTYFDDPMHVEECLFEVRFGRNRLDVVCFSGRCRDQPLEVEYIKQNRIPLEFVDSVMRRCCAMVSTKLCRYVPTYPNSIHLFNVM